MPREAEYGEGDVQIRVHLLKSALSLGKEVVDYALRELALLFVIVHLKDLRT